MPRPPTRGLSLAVAGSLLAALAIAQQRQPRREPVQRLVAPVLASPSDGASSSTSRVAFSWGAVSGANFYLLCVALPGKSCPAVPTDTPEVLVVRTSSTSQTLALDRFGGKSVAWTAAACASTSLYAYQVTPRRLTVPRTAVKVVQTATVDRDRDGVDDKEEDALAKRWAPLVRLPPSDKDWTRPANVDWYLRQVRMRYDHGGGCPDHQILDVGQVNQANLYRQRHREGKGVPPFCGHTDSYEYSSHSAERFFLQPPNDDVHKGASSQGDWKVYTHVAKSRVIREGHFVQYWFFYAYNDFIGPINHEGDWEHVSLTVDAGGAFRWACFSQHNGRARYSRQQLQWTDDGRPVVFVADGSHANYPAASLYKLAEVHYGIDMTNVYDRTYGNGPAWRSWETLVNVGEQRAPLNGQEFMRYGGLWGEIGRTGDTSGPTGPGYKGTFQTDQC